MRWGFGLVVLHWPRQHGGPTLPTGGPGNFIGAPLPTRVMPWGSIYGLLCSSDAITTGSLFVQKGLSYALRHTLPQASISTRSTGSSGVRR